MPFSNWRAYTPFAVGIAALLLLLFAGLSNHHQKQTRCAETGPQQNSTRTPCDVGKARVTPVGGIKTPQPEPEPKRGEWREESDLEAQWSMAWWARAAVAISGVGLIVTAFGVVLVRQTLDANRAAVVEAQNATANAREIGQAQVRAYLTVTNVGLRIDYPCPYLQVTLVNSGNSPAMNVNVMASLSWRFGGMPDPPELGGSGFLAGTLRQGQEIDQAIFMGTANFSMIQNRLAAERVVFLARITASYLDVFRIPRTDVFEFQGTVMAPARNTIVGLGPHHEFVM